MQHCKSTTDLSKSLAPPALLSSASQPVQVLSQTAEPTKKIQRSPAAHDLSDMEEIQRVMGYSPSNSKFADKLRLKTLVDCSSPKQSDRQPLMNINQNQKDYQPDEGSNQLNASPDTKEEGIPQLDLGLTPIKAVEKATVASESSDDFSDFEDDFEEDEEEADRTDKDEEGDGDDGTEGWFEHDHALPKYSVPTCIPGLDLANMPEPEIEEEEFVDAGASMPGFLNWGVADVCTHLEKAGFKQYVNIARAARLDGACLARMTQQQFEGLGIKSEHVQQIMDMLTAMSSTKGSSGSSGGEDAGDSVVLEEKMDPDYVPSEAEIKEYAEFLGMDLPKENALLWIAKQGLTTPIPAQWKPCKTKDTGEVYYFNFETGESIWEHPNDVQFMALYKKLSAELKAGTYTAPDESTIAALMRGNAQPGEMPTAANEVAGSETENAKQALDGEGSESSFASDEEGDGDDGTEGWFEHDHALPKYAVPTCIPGLDLANMPEPEIEEEEFVDAGANMPGFLNWGVADVCTHLEKAGFKQYVNIARAARLDGACLARMTQQQFEGLGIKSEHVQQIMDMLTAMSSTKGSSGSSGGEDAGDSVVLEEKMDPDYVPSEAEIKEYAEFLGMDLPKENALLWIAKQGLTTPIPAQWKPCKTKDTGEVYYFNFETGESIWEHPVDQHFMALYKEKQQALEAGEDVTEEKEKEKEDGADAVAQAEDVEKAEKEAKKAAELRVAHEEYWEQRRRQEAEQVEQHAVYRHSDGTEERVRVVKRHPPSEGGGFTIFVPSVDRERHTVTTRIRIPDQEEAATAAVGRQEEQQEEQQEQQQKAQKEEQQEQKQEKQKQEQKQQTGAPPSYSEVMGTEGAEEPAAVDVPAVEVPAVEEVPAAVSSPPSAAAAAVEINAELAEVAEIRAVDQQQEGPEEQEAPRTDSPSPASEGVTSAAAASGTRATLTPALEVSTDTQDERPVLSSPVAASPVVRSAVAVVVAEPIEQEQQQEGPLSESHDVERPAS